MKKEDDEENPIKDEKTEKGKKEKGKKKIKEPGFLGGDSFPEEETPEGHIKPPEDEDEVEKLEPLEEEKEVEHPDYEEKRVCAPGTKVPGIHNPHSMDGIRRSHKKQITPKEAADAGAMEGGAYGLHIAPQTYDVHQPSNIKTPDIKKVRRKKEEEEKS